VHDPRDPVVVLRALGGRGTRQQVLSRTSKERLRDAVAAGLVLRMARGVYAVPTLLPAFAAAARLRGVISHASAAQVWHLDLVEEPREIHVTVLHGRGRSGPLPGVRIHQARSLPDGDVTQGVTTPLRTVLDCAATMPFAHALAVADSALSSSMLYPDKLRAAALATRGPGRRSRLLVAQHADRRSHSALESVLRALLIQAGLTMFVPQHEVWLGKRLLRVDLGDRELRLAIEAEGYAFHGDAAALQRDCERYDALTAGGWIVLRFTWAQVITMPEWVVGTVVETRRVLSERIGRAHLMDGMHTA
jgi:very-short-patch-repair endonuclease